MQRTITLIQHVRVIASHRLICSSVESVKKTPLHDFHIEKGAKMVTFAGFSMPVQYADQSLIESHLHTRAHVSLFDVSHMLQTRVHGKHRVDFIESLVTSDIRGLAPGRGTLTLFTNEYGGIKDDLIVTNAAENYLYVVTNAGCIEKDMKHLQTAAEKFRSNGFDLRVEHVDQTERCLLALQGPHASRLLTKENCSVDVSELYFMNSAVGSLYGISNCRITRCGYTGEDGFEISVESKRAAELCTKFLQSNAARVKLAGLGARDSLRLEAGLCLYGNDIDEHTSPVEAGLTWLISKRRRETKDFPGAAAILRQIDQKSVGHKRIGLLGSRGRPPRNGCKLLTRDGQEVGKITSGCPSPCLKKNIAMGYCMSELASLGYDLQAVISPSVVVPVKVVQMPFVPTHYYHKPKL